MTRGLLAYATCLVLLCAGCTAARESERKAPPDIGGALSARLAEAAPGAAIRIGGAPLRRSAPIRAFYARRGYAPVWVGAGALTSSGAALLAALAASQDEGLSPAYYRVQEISALTRALDGKGKGSAEEAAGRRADLELLLSDGFLGYAEDLSRGHVEANAISAPRFIPREKPRPGEWLRAAAQAGNPEDYLRGLLPRHPLYLALRREFARYRALAAAGGWQPVPDTRKLEKGDRGRDVRALRARLAAEGYPDPDGDGAAPAPGEAGKSGATDRFDTALADALRAYQRRNGLDVDGIAGDETFAALNVPAARRASQIAANMERVRWLPRSLGERYLLVDIAGFRLVIFENDRPALSMPVIVGRESRETPVFSATLNHVVFNPYWRVPRSIAIEDELPKIREDPAFFTEHEMELFRYKPGGGLRPIDPATVDWSRVNEDNFAYFLRQKPGAKNALGRVKFMFPNRHSVYLHDTPARNLFRQSKRTFSSGCIRVARPIDLGEYLMAANPGWDRAHFEEAIDAGETRTVHLSRPLPIYLVYLTVWAEAGGPAGFRRDIYARDRALIAALADESGAQSAARALTAPPRKAAESSGALPR